MNAIIDQVLILAIFVVIGVILGKTGVVSTEHAKLLSILEVYLFVPSTNINSFSVNFTKDYLREQGSMILVSALILSVIMLAFCFLGKKLGRSDNERAIFEYALVLPNYAFFGYPIVKELFGDVMLTSFIFYCIPLTIISNSWGYYILTGGKKQRLIKLINPSIIGVFLGMLAGIFEVRIPSAIHSVLEHSAACLSPVAMLLLGIIVSEYLDLKLLKGWRNYIVVLFRAIVIPCVLWISLRHILNPTLVICTVLCYAMPCGLNVIVFPKLKEQDCSQGASIVLLTTVASVLCLPFFLYVLTSFS